MTEHNTYPEAQLNDPTLVSLRRSAHIDPIVGTWPHLALRLSNYLQLAVGHFQRVSTPLGDRSTYQVFPLTISWVDTSCRRNVVSALQYYVSRPSGHPGHRIKPNYSKLPESALVNRSRSRPNAVTKSLRNNLTPSTCLHIAFLLTHYVLEIWMVKQQQTESQERRVAPHYRGRNIKPRNLGGAPYETPETRRDLQVV